MLKAAHLCIATCYFFNYQSTMGENTGWNWRGKGNSRTPTRGMPNFKLVLIGCGARYWDICSHEILHRYRIQYRSLPLNYGRCTCDFSFLAVHFTLFRKITFRSARSYQVLPYLVDWYKRHLRETGYLLRLLCSANYQCPVSEGNWNNHLNTILSGQ